MYSFDQLLCEQEGSELKGMTSPRGNDNNKTEEGMNNHSQATINKMNSSVLAPLSSASMKPLPSTAAVELSLALDRWFSWPAASAESSL